MDHQKNKTMVTRAQLERIKIIWDGYRVEQDVIVSSNLTLEDWIESGEIWGRNFNKSDDVKGFVAHGEQYPLSGMDSSVEEILALPDVKAKANGYVVLRGSDDDGFNIWCHSPQQIAHETRELAEKSAATIAKNENKQAGRNFKEQEPGWWIDGHDCIKVFELNKRLPKWGKVHTYNNKWDMVFQK